MGMSWGGIQHPWTSWKTLVPLILSALGLVVFLLYEFNWGREPVVPWKLVSNWTSLFGYVMMFLHGVVVVKAICEWTGFPWLKYNLFFDESL